MAEDIVMTIATKMHLYPYENILNSDYMMEVFNEKDIQDLLNQLNVENLKIWIYS